MLPSADTADAVILYATKSALLREKFIEIARNSEDHDYGYVAGQYEGWFLAELDNYEVTHSDPSQAENPDEVTEIEFLFGTFLRSAIQTMPDDGWNKIAQHFLPLI